MGGRIAHAPSVRPRTARRRCLDRSRARCYVKTMPLRRSILFLVVGAMMSLAVLAYASPPDPDWISGLWDNGDYDDIILLVTSGVGVADSHAIEDGRPFVIVVALAATDDGDRIPARPRPSSPTRAPP